MAEGFSLDQRLDDSKGISQVMLRLSPTRAIKYVFAATVAAIPEDFGDLGNERTPTTLLREYFDAVTDPHRFIANAEPQSRSGSKTPCALAI